MEPDEWRLTAERADEEGDMLLAVVGGPEGNDLRRRHVGEGKRCPRDDLDGGVAACLVDLVHGHANVGRVRIE